MPLSTSFFPLLPPWLSPYRYREDDYNSLRASLIDRLNDKEWTVRYQAVLSLVKLCGTEDPSELSTGEQSILTILLETMIHDPSAYVYLLLWHV